MSSLQPQQSQASRTAARRRQRSTRLTVAVALLAVAAAVVLGALASASAVLTTVAAVLAVLAGAAATRITHSELMPARVEAAHDRAVAGPGLPRDHRASYGRDGRLRRDMRRKIAEREEAIDVLERALSTAQKNAAEQTLKRAQEARRADVAERGRPRDGRDRPTTAPPRPSCWSPSSRRISTCSAPSSSRCVQTPRVALTAAPEASR